MQFSKTPDVGDCETIIEYTGTATILVEDDGTISAANTEFESLSGYSHKEIVYTKQIGDFIAFEDERQQIMKYHVLRRDDPVAAPKNYSFSFVDRYGDIHAVEVTIGMVPGVDRSIMSLLDVTERVRAEQALRESEERLDLAFTTADDGLIDWDISTGEIYCSPRCFTMLGYDPEVCIPTPSSLLSYIHSDDQDRVNGALAGMVAGKYDHIEVEFQVQSASGEWIYMLGRFRVVSQDMNGAPLRIAGTCTDITGEKVAERELLIREMAMESSFSAIAIADLDGCLTYVNQTLLDMTRCSSPDEILGKHITEFWAEPDKAKVAFQTLIEEGRCTEELVSRRTDGTEFVVHVNANIVTERSGDPVCIMATAVDVTEERRTEEAFRESEERYRTLAELSPDIIFLIDVEGNILYVNSAGGRLFGVEPERLWKRNIRDLLSSTTVKRWSVMLQKAAKPAAETLIEETLLPWKDDDIWFETRLIPMVEGDGAVKGLLGISRDITDRKRAEEQLHFQSRVLRQVNDAVIAVGLKGEIVYMNRAAERLYDTSSSEILGSPIEEIFTYEWLHPGDKDAVKDSIRSFRTWRGVILHRKRNGETIFVGAAISALEDNHGDVVGTLYSLQDITEQRQAEFELMVKNMAMESSLSAIALSDLEGKIIYVNQASLAMHGWRREEVIGESFSIVWANRREAELTREEAFRNGAWFGEIEAQRSDGTTFPVQLALSIVTDESGRPLFLMGSGIDVSQRRLAEQDLRVRDMAIASSINAFTLANLDGHLTYVNQAFLSMWGYDSPDEVLGRSVTEFWQDEGDARYALQKILDSGKYIGERVGRRKDGTTFYIMYSGNLVTDDAGTPICLMASIADITEQKRAETRIQAHNRELSILNQIIGASISATNLNDALRGVLATTIDLLNLRGGEIYLIKTERQCAQIVSTQGLSEGLTERKYIPDITAHPYAEVLVEGNVLFIGDPGEGDLYPYVAIPIVAPGGIIGSLNLVPLDRRQFTDADRSFLAVIGRKIGSSIERTLLIQQLEEAKRETNLYLDILSHDIRNAENVSGLYIDHLINMLEGETKEYAQRIRSSIRKSTEILRNVSTIRRIHHEPTMLAPVDLDQVIRGEIEIFPEIRFHYKGTDLMVMADPLLPEIFTNLIGNAIKFGGSSVEVTINVEESGDDVLISVEDTGPGIPDSMKEAVFMRFGRKKDKKSGQGLGLYITRTLIERYGGQIQVDDRVPGRSKCGAAFWFTLKRV